MPEQVAVRSMVSYLKECQMVYPALAQFDGFIMEFYNQFKNYLTSRNHTRKRLVI